MNCSSEMAVKTPQSARILIVEDEPLVAEDLRTVLVDAGFEITGVAARVATALSLIETVACDAAIVDANLAGASASPVAAVLSARGLPFIVLSGYTREQLQSEFSGGFFIEKPYRLTEVIDSLSTILPKR
jgi:DNA-binding response OmpR family regulator